MCERNSKIVKSPRGLGHVTFGDVFRIAVRYTFCSICARDSKEQKDTQVSPELLKIVEDLKYGVGVHNAILKEISS